MRLFIFLTAILTMQTAFGTPPGSSIAYADDLAIIYGDIQQVKAWEEICSEQFPSTRDPNRGAVERWRDQYSPFIQEIERRWAKLISDKSKGDETRKDAMVAGFQKLYQETKNDFRQKLLADGRELFQRRCENYPLYLRSPRMNLEDVHADAVKRVRQEAVPTKEALLARALSAMTFGPSTKKGLIAEKQRAGRTNKFIEAAVAADDAQLEEIASRVYAKYLSQQQVEEILRFYESAAGRSLVAQQARDISNPRPMLSLQSEHAAEARAFTNSATGKTLALLTGSQAIWAEIREAIRVTLAR